LVKNRSTPLSTLATARDYDILACHVCGLLTKCVPSVLKARCPRCSGILHAVKPRSLPRSLALLIAAAILYIPANVLPIMHTSTLMYDEDDTILSGVVALWTSGSWPLAMLVFFVSILVPTLKLLTLSLLVLSTHYQWQWRLPERTQLYRLIEFVGRWSMLDVFVVALLVALVQLRGIAIIHAGPGAIAFAAVVVLTMYAAQAFDPRLMWGGAKS
jgi:paraquat-inducible protein A